MERPSTLAEGGRGGHGHLIAASAAPPHLPAPRFSAMALSASMHLQLFVVAN